MTNAQLKLAAILAGMRIKWHPAAGSLFGRFSFLAINGLTVGWTERKGGRKWVGAFRTDSTTAYDARTYPTERGATVAVERFAFKKALNLL
jgi:hypothetical protein